MGFWGIEVKPGKPHPYHSDNVQGTLYVTQATLGLGSSTEKSILQCSVGHKSPIFLCTLLPDKNESCSLNLEFKDELVAFSVIGPRSIHISGYFGSDEGDNLRDEYDSDSGEDIADTETDDSSEYDYDDEYDDDDFIKDDEDGDFEMFSPSAVPNSGVVIEEIMEDDKPANGNVVSNRSKKKKRSSDSEAKNNSQKQIVAKTNTDISVLGSEDEDGFPIFATQKGGKALQTQENPDDKKAKRTSKKAEKKKERDEDNDDSEKKRKVDCTNVVDQSEIKKKNKRRKKRSKKGEELNTLVMDEDDRTNGNTLVMDEDDKDKKNDNTLVMDEDDKKNDNTHVTDEEDKKNDNTHVTDEEDKNNDNAHVTDEEDKKSNLPKTEVHPEDAMKQVSPERNGQGGIDVAAGDEQGEKSSGKKKKKKKKKSKILDSEEGANKGQGVSPFDNKTISSFGSSENQSATKPSNVRGFSNGLIIEDLEIGKPDGKRASPGTQVSMRYIGKLKKNGQIFDSNIGRAPYKFRLGVGQVIKGWDVGINGMRVGDKRRLTIPPSMGYGDKGAGAKIPPNSWLVFDIELVDVN